MYVANQVSENAAMAQADNSQAVAAQPVVSAVREHAAGTPAELSEKGRIVRAVA